MLYVLSTILMLTVLLSFASCKKDDDVTDSAIDTSQSENQEPQEPISEYELIYESYGNGTCDVTGIWISPGSRDVTITVPAISPDGERVISCNIRCNPIPKIIKKDVFESEICEPILAAIENGTLGGVDSSTTPKDILYAHYRIFTSYFTLYDINDSDSSQKSIDMMLQTYPITQETAIYVFESSASSAEILDISRYISEYTNFFESDSYQESISISKDYQNTFCMYDVVTKVVFEDGIQTICSAAGHRNVTELVLPDSIISIEKDAFLGYDNLIEIENGVSYIDKWVIDCNTDVTNVSLRANTIGIAEDVFCFSSLTSIEIPNSVTTIGDRAFFGCSNLETIIYHGTEEEWDAITSGQFEYLSGNITFLG